MFNARSETFVSIKHGYARILHPEEIANLDNRARQGLVSLEKKLKILSREKESYPKAKFLQLRIPRHAAASQD